MLYLKLFIVMGVNWLTEIISWASRSNYSKSVFYVTDVSSHCKKCYFFLIFVWKKTCFKFIKQTTLEFNPRFQLFNVLSVF